MTKAKLKNALDSKETKDNKPDGVVASIDVPPDSAAPGPIDRLCTGVPSFLQADEDTANKAADTPFGRFTWTIPEFSKLQSSKRELRSHVFSVGSYKWYILVYPKGCDVCNHLSLFLCVAEYDKLLPGWHHFAQFTIAVVNQDPKKSKYSDTLHRFCKKEHDWGWKKFLELSKINDGFIANDTLTIKAQVQVIIDKPGRPFACLYPMYRHELLRVYLSNVEGVCKRFCDDKRTRLVWLNDPAFHNFWKTVPADKQKRLLSERVDIILKGLLKQFFSEKEVITTLVMDALYCGCCKLHAQSKAPVKASQPDSNQPLILVDRGGCDFNLHANVANLPARLAAEYVISLTDAAKGNVASDTGRSGHEGDMSSTRREVAEQDETRLIELGVKTVQMFIIAHICTEKVEVSYREAEALRRQDQLIAEETLQQEVEDARRREQALRDKERRARKKERLKQRKDNDKLQQDNAQPQTAIMISEPITSQVQQSIVTTQTHQQPFNLPSSSSPQPRCDNVKHPTFGTFTNGSACLLPPNNPDNEQDASPSHVLQPLDINTQQPCSSGSLQPSQPHPAAFVLGGHGFAKPALPNASPQQQQQQQQPSSHANEPLQPSLQFGDVLVYSSPSASREPQETPSTELNNQTCNNATATSSDPLTKSFNRTCQVQESSATAVPDTSLQTAAEISCDDINKLLTTGPVTESELVVLRQQVDDLRQALLSSSGMVDSLRAQVGCLSAELNHGGKQTQQQQQQPQQQAQQQLAPSSSSSSGKQDGSKKRPSDEAFSDTESSTLHHHHSSSLNYHMHRSASEFSFCKPSALQRQSTASSLQHAEHHYALHATEHQACMNTQGPAIHHEPTSSNCCNWSTSAKRGSPYEGLRPVPNPSGVSYGRFGSDIPVDPTDSCHHSKQLPMHHNHGVSATNTSITSTVEALFPSYRNAALQSHGVGGSGRTVKPTGTHCVWNPHAYPVTAAQQDPVPAAPAKGGSQENLGDLTSSSSSEQSVLTVALDTSLAYSDDTLASLASLTHDSKSRAFSVTSCAVAALPDAESSPYEFAHMGIINDLLLD